jgi:hypothetical protein
MKKAPIFLIILAAIASIPNITLAANASDFNGGVSIGSGYYGTTPAPTDGLIVQGNVGIGTSTPVSGAALTVNGAIAATSLILGGTQTPLTPGGRLTLTTNTPVMTADVLAATTVYYSSYVNDIVPIYDGTNWKQSALGGQISLALDSNSGHTGYQQSGKLFDLVIRDNAGTPQLCTGPAWTSNTARASAVAMQNGIWTNSGSWTVKCDTTSSTETCAANQCTYVGTMYASANGQTGLQCQPAIAAGGPTGGGYINIWNAYNRAPISCQERDSTMQWTDSTAGDRNANNSVNNRIHFVDGLQQSPIEGSYTVQAANNTLGKKCIIGVILDTGSARTYAFMAAPTSTLANNWLTLVAPATYSPQLGRHSFIAREDIDSVGSNTCTFNQVSSAPNNTSGMMLKLNFSY